MTPDALYERYKARQTAALVVACPRCKAPVNEPCVWGVTNNGSVHLPRLRKTER